LRCRDQRLEQPWIVTRLRVPLDREHERMVLPAGQLGRFDYPVRRPGGGGQACPQLVDRLMVGGGHRKRPVRLQDAGQHAACRDPHRVAAEGPRLRGVARVPGRPQVGQVLVQGAAPGDVEQLQAAADAEHRQPGRQRRRQQVHFRSVALGADPAGARVRRRTVGGRVDVPAAGEHQPIQSANRGGDPGDRRQQHRHPARGRYLLGVVQREQRCRGMPGPPPGRLGVAAEPDDRLHSGVT
jgi:hypothetical protein